MHLKTFILLFASITIVFLTQANAQSHTPPAQELITPWTDHHSLHPSRNKNGRYNARNSIKAQRHDSTPAPKYSPTPKHHRVPPNNSNRQNQQLPFYSPTSQKFPSSAIPPAQIPSSSAIENIYSERIVDEIEQFGYGLFGVPKTETTRQLDTHSKYATNSQRTTPIRNTPIGAVQDDFILNSGDEVEIMFTGQRSDRAIYKINTQGTLLIEDFPPIPAAGRTINQVHISIQAAAANLYNTQSYISLASVRQIGVLVVGHVKKPGRQNLTVFHSVLDALMESRGIQKTGSLRNIKLIRHGRSTIIDLYTLLMHGGTNIDLTLRDGDRLIIPPIGPTVAVAGEVKRPGIYELSTPLTSMHHEKDQNIEKLSLNDMLDLGGGILIPGQNRFLKLSINNKGEESVSEVNDPFHPQFGDGSILVISKGQGKRSGMVEITGHTRKAGLHALSKSKTLSALISDETALGPDIYPLIGVIERWDTEQLTTKMISFPLRLVLKKKFDRQLMDGDVIHLFSKTQMSNLHHAQNHPSQPIEYGSFSPNEDFDEFYHNIALQSFLSERVVYVRGAVRTEGAYPVGEGTTLDSLIAIAGGLTLEANTTNIEVTSALNRQGHQSNGRSGTSRTQINFATTHPKTIQIEAGDSVRVNTKFKKLNEKSILIMGEISSPGHYDLLPGDKMSDLLKRAGGLTKQAYPKGAIFSRASERKAEESRFRAAARDLEHSIAVAIEQGERDNKDGPNLQKIAMAQDLSTELRNVKATGRITVESDPAILSVEPELDILLEAGDRLFIPKRPLTVRVSGEILSPASLQFRENKTPLDYIHQAGGFTYDADKERTFVLYPDGSAQPLQVSTWNHRATFIPPGSTIIVPRDPKPFDFIQSAKDISQILSNLAITGVFIDDIKD